MKKNTMVPIQIKSNHHYFALEILMGLMRVLSLSDYCKKSGLFANPYIETQDLKYSENSFILSKMKPKSIRT